MLNIKFKGKYTDENQIKKGTLPTNAIKFEEPNNISKVFLLGFKISSPILIASTIILFYKLDNFFDLPFYTFILMISLNQILLYVHEFIHALTLPLNLEKEIWTKQDEGYLFVTFYKPITKLRFIYMSFAPNLILGFIPFILFMFGFFDFNNIICNIVGVVSWSMIISGVGDYLNIYNATTQVPKNAKIQNYGMHSYWFKSD